VIARPPPRLAPVDDDREPADPPGLWWRSSGGIVTMGFMAVADAYRAYMLRVPGFLPRFGSRGGQAPA
jgi:hypothetical protein